MGRFCIIRRIKIYKCQQKKPLQYFAKVFFILKITINLTLTFLKIHLNPCLSVFNQCAK